MAEKSSKPWYWYLHHVGECPVCGRDCSHKEAQYTPRPERDQDRYKQLPDAITYCGCLERG